VLDVKSHLSRRHILSQLETAVLDSTRSMHQLEVLGASLLLKLLVTDLWTLLWTILFIRLMWENSTLLISIDNAVESAVNLQSVDFNEGLVNIGNYS